MIQLPRFLTQSRWAQRRRALGYLRGAWQQDAARERAREAAAAHDVLIRVVVRRVLRTGRTHVVVVGGE